MTTTTTTCSDFNDDSVDYVGYYKNKSNYDYICQSCIKIEDGYEDHSNLFSIRDHDKYLKRNNRRKNTLYLLASEILFK